MIFVWIVAGLLVAAVIFWLGAKYGGKIATQELLAERRLSSVIQKERSELKNKLECAQSAVTKMGLDVKKIFPWLTLLLCIGSTTHWGL